MGEFVDFEVAYVKINLALHVRERRSDGYHSIETLFAFAEDGDILSVAPASALTLSIYGPFSNGLSGGSDNLVMRAALALQQAYGVDQGAALTLDKRLPIAAGIGGGSADAAAALRLLARYWKLNANDAALVDIAKTLGADVPACVVSQTVRGEGVGDVLHPVAAPGLKDVPILLINPRVSCPTGAVFAAWDGIDLGALSRGDIMVAAQTGRNDLQPPALRIVPEIQSICAFMQAQPGNLLTRMSGSVATCFSLYRNSDDCERAQKACPPQWWSMASRLRYIQPSSNRLSIKSSGIAP